MKDRRWLRSYAQYWEAYGGFRAIITSPYLWASVVIYSLYCLAQHAGMTNNDDNEWWSLCVEIIPSLLGFMLGGYAVWLVIGNDQYRAFLAYPRKSSQHSPYMIMNARFIHFILVQVLTLICALISYAFKGLLLTDVIGVFLMIYSILGVPAVAIAIFGYAGVYEEWIKRKNNSQNVEQT